MSQQAANRGLITRFWNEVYVARDYDAVGRYFAADGTELSPVDGVLGREARVAARRVVVDVLNPAVQVLESPDGPVTEKLIQFMRIHGEMGLTRREDETARLQPAQREPVLQRPAEPRRAPSAEAQIYAPRRGQLDEQGRPVAQARPAHDDEQFEIPAFLRRQSS